MVVVDREGMECGSLGYVTMGGDRQESQLTPCIVCFTFHQICSVSGTGAQSEKPNEDIVKEAYAAQPTLKGAKGMPPSDYG